MKKLLIGLLMLVVTNLMAAPKEIIPEPPAYDVTETMVCKNNIMYHVEKSKVHMLVEQVWDYNKIKKVWEVKTCVGA